MYFYCVIQLGFRAGPTASIGTDQIGSMTNGSKNKSIVLRLNYFFMTQPDRQPITAGLLDPNRESLAKMFLYARFHHSKFITGVFY